MRVMGDVERGLVVECVGEAIDRLTPGEKLAMRDGGLTIGEGPVRGDP